MWTSSKPQRKHPPLRQFKQQGITGYSIQRILHVAASEVLSARESARLGAGLQIKGATLPARKICRLTAKWMAPSRSTARTHRSAPRPNSILRFTPGR